MRLQFTNILHSNYMQDKNVCGAFDFDTNIKGCFFIVLKKAFNTMTAIGVDHYTRDNNCEGKSFPIETFNIILL